MHIPIMLEFSGKRAIVFGAGSVGMRRAFKYKEAGADVLVVSRHFSDAALDRLREHQIKIETSSYCPELMEGFDFVTAATGQKEINHKIIRDAKIRGILSNSAEGGEGDFQFPAQLIREHAKVSVSTGVPAYTKYIREQLEDEILQISDKAALLQKLRQELKKRKISTSRLSDYVSLSASQLAEIVDRIEKENNI